LFPLADPDVDSVYHIINFPLTAIYVEVAMNNLINESPILYQVLLYDKNIAFILTKR